jgi:fibronectin type 3 domain-containing protein
LTGTGGNSRFVQLSWTGSISSGIAGYNVYRSTSTAGAYSKLVSSPVTGTSYTDQTVQSGDEYYYVVTTVGTNGQESTYSSQVAASIP